MTGGQDIVINGRFLTRRVSGVERYATEVVKALDGLLAEMEPQDRPRATIVAPRGARTLSGLRVIETCLHGRYGGHAWEQTVLPLASGDAVVLNLCNTAPVLHGRQLNCIHDANVWLMPENYSFAFRALYKAMIPLNMASSRAWVTDSEFSKQELERVALPGTRPGVVLLCGHEHVFEWDERDSRLPDAVFDERYVLVVGSRAKNKNIGIVLKQARALAEAGIRIYVTGAYNGAVFADLGDNPTDETITWLGNVNDGDLRRLYSRALCLAFPSFFEGFGLPVLEAMALGCPVVASPRTSIPEIGGDAIIYADPSNGQEWLEAIVGMANDEPRRLAFAAAGRSRAKVFRWRIVALEYLQLCGVRAGPQFERKA